MGGGGVTRYTSSLRESGLSERAIAAATGLGRSTVQRELAGVPNGTREPSSDRPFRSRDEAEAFVANEKARYEDQLDLRLAMMLPLVAGHAGCDARARTEWWCAVGPLDAR